MSAVAEFFADTCGECNNPLHDCGCEHCTRCGQLLVTDSDGLCAECRTEIAEHRAEMAAEREMGL